LHLLLNNSSHKSSKTPFSAKVAVVAAAVAGVGVARAMALLRSSRLLAVRVAIVVLFLLLCGYALSTAEGARPLHGGSGAGFSTANLPVFVVARAGPSRRGAGH